jgi:type II secretory pathway component PulF
VELNQKFSRWSYRNSIKARLRLWRKLASLLANGVPLLRALTELQDRRIQASGARHIEARVLGIWRSRISNGGTFASAIDGWVTADEQMLLSAGEQEGDMAAAFGRLELLLTARSKIVKAIAGALAYPLTLIMMSMALLSFYAWKIVPAFLGALATRSGEFEGMAASLIWLTGVVRHWLWLWVLLLVLAAVLFFWTLPRWDGRLRVVLDRYAPYGLYRIMRGTAWLLSLSALMGVGRRVEDALLLLQKYDNGLWSAQRSALCLSGIRRGLSLGASLEASRTGFPDREVIADLLVYSKLNGADKAIAIIAQELLEDSLERIQKQSLLMRNVGLFVVAGVLGWTTSGLMAMNLQISRILSGAPPSPVSMSSPAPHQSNQLALDAPFLHLPPTS